MSSGPEPLDEEAVRDSGGSSNSSGFEIVGDTISVASSITKYRIENGRSYHAYKDGVYWAPNDEQQNEELDITHHKFLLMLEGKLYLAPIPQNVERVLDIGTGTGIWAMDFADEHPRTTVLGTDLSPIQPAMVPPNCMFEIDDVRDLWTYPPDYFDFIHIRGMYGSINDWPALYRQVYRHLKPGGFLEHLEISISMRSDDGTLNPNGFLGMLEAYFTKIGDITGQSFNVFHFMTDNIKQAGFEEVVETVFQVPLGGWPIDRRLRDLGHWCLLAFDLGLEGYTMAMLTRILQWTTDEVHVFLAQVRKEARDKKNHSYHEVKVTYAQKPLTPPGSQSVP